MFKHIQSNLDHLKSNFLLREGAWLKSKASNQDPAKKATNNVVFKFFSILSHFITCGEFEIKIMNLIVCGDHKTSFSKLLNLDEFVTI